MLVVKIRSDPGFAPDNPSSERSCRSR